MGSAKRVLGKLERLGLERHQRDLALAARPGGHPKGFWFDSEAAERPIIFIERFCKHHKGEWAGRPLLLDEWQKTQIRILFGWKRADGTRRFRKAWWEVPRKNGKTEIAGALELYMLVADGEAGAECYATATKRDQARILHDTVVAMVKASPELRRFVKVFRNTLVCERLGSKAEPLSSDHSTLDGLSPHFDGRDEVHAWPDHGLASVLDTATGARRQPLTLEITTAGTYDQNGVGWQHHDYAVKVLEGVFEDDRLFVYIAAIDEDDDPFDPATWAKANPNLGISLKRDYIAEQAELARRQPSFTNEFLRLHLNRWTQQVTRWLSVEDWRESERHVVQEEDLAGLTCVGGLDLSSKLDLAAFAAVLDDGDWLTLLLRFWLPENRVVEQAKKGRRHYEQWAKDGWITTTPGDVIDYGFIRRDINELAHRITITEIAYDPWNATQIANDLAADGFQMVETRQGPRTLSEPCKNFEARIVAKRVRQVGAPNPVMRWMVGNAVVRRDSNGNIAPDKEKASDKIDGVAATVTAMSRIITRDGASETSMYETEGITSV